MNRDNLYIITSTTCGHCVNYRKNAHAKFISTIPSNILIIDLEITSDKNKNAKIMASLPKYLKIEYVPFFVYVPAKSFSDGRDIKIFGADMETKGVPPNAENLNFWLTENIKRYNTNSVSKPKVVIPSESLQKKISFIPRRITNLE